MAINLAQFHQVFFEESFENVDIMENALMHLDPKRPDAETINGIFRAAHSIKGGSATFGFKAIAGFTHLLETLLDLVRGNQLQLLKTDIDLLFQSVDCMRELLAAHQQGRDAETALSVQLKAALHQRLSAVGQVAAVAPALATAPEARALRRWQLYFKPGPAVIKTGNDPLRLLQALGSLGDMQVEVDVEGLPALASFDAEASYLAWHITLLSRVEKTEIEEIFEWVADESVITIHCLDDDVALAASADEDTFFEIDFIPQPSLLRSGNDPLKLLRALAALGTLRHCHARVSLPPLSAIDAEQCYLAWELSLEAPGATEADVRAVFEWVEDECELRVKPVAGIYRQASSADNGPEQRVSTPTAVIAMETSLAVPAVTESASVPAGMAKVNTKASAETSSIRVGIDKIDSLINLVGELVITQSMLGQLGSEFSVDRLPKLLEGLSQLEQNTRELQESVMRIRMLPISVVFSRFPRMVRDLSQTLGKEVQLELVGESTELDKTVLEKIGDPMVHLVRNAVDHGIETVEERRRKGKADSGCVRLNAYHQGGNVVIEVTDDGKGLDADVLKEKAIEKGIISALESEQMSREQAFDLIFEPGFSTAKTVSDVSGRGVGMDVVKRNIQALNGAIEIHSEIDRGSTITIRLPLTLAILDGQLVRVANQTYIFPLVSIVESLQCKPDLINRVAGGGEVFRLREEYVPILHLAKVFDIPLDQSLSEQRLMVVVESDTGKVGIVVDELLAQQQVVIKSLEQNYRRVAGVSGATILGDGTVALIVDIPGIVRLASDQEAQALAPANVASFELQRIKHKKQITM